MIKCLDCGHGIIAISKNRLYHWGCRHRTKWLAGKGNKVVKDIEHGIGLFKLYQCKTCKQEKWGLLFKHMFHSDHLWCSEHYHVIDICRKCYRKKFHDKTYAMAIQRHCYETIKKYRGITNLIIKPDKSR